MSPEAGQPLPPSPFFGGRPSPISGALQGMVEMQRPELIPPETDWTALEEGAMTREIKLNDELETKIKTFLETEIDRAYKFFQTIHSRYKEYREAYLEWRQEKKFPWDNCSNVTVSLTAPFVNQVVGRNVRILRSTYPPITVEPLPGVSEQFASAKLLKAIEDYINAQLISNDRFFSSIFEWALESAITGTGICKVFWDEAGRDRQIRGYSTFWEPGMSKQIPLIEDKTTTGDTGIKSQLIRSEDFIFQPEAVNDSNGIQTGQWVAQRYRERWGEMQKKAKSGIYRASECDKIRFDSDQADPRQGSIFVDKSAGMGFGPVYTPSEESARELVLHEVWAEFPIGPNGEEKQCVFVWNHKRKILLSARYNMYFHGLRPFVPMRYWPLQNSLLGRGIPNQLRYSQKASDDVMNAVIDALTLANMPIMVSSRQSGIKPGKNDRLWPGRLLQLDEPDSFKQVKFADPSPETINIINQIERFAQRAAGVNQDMSGLGSGNQSRESAYGAMAREGAASPMYDITVSEMRSAIGELAEMYLALSQQFNPNGNKYLSYATNGDLVANELKLPLQTVVGKYRFRVVASSSGANPEIRKRSLQELNTVLQPLFQQIAETVGQMSNPGMPEAVRETMTASLRANIEIVRQICQSYNIPAAENLAPDWSTFWGKIKPLLDQTIAAAKNKPPTFDDAIVRKIGPAFREMTAEEQVAFMENIGLTPGEERKRLAEQERSGIQPAPMAGVGEGGFPAGPDRGMGSVGPIGPTGLPGPIGQMPGVPTPGFGGP